MTQYVIIAKRNIWRGRKNHARSRIKENISRKEKGTFMSKVRRVYVEKKLAFAVKAKELQAEIKSYLGISSVTGVRELIRYRTISSATNILPASSTTRHWSGSTVRTVSILS